MRRFIMICLIVINALLISGCEGETQKQEKKTSVPETSDSEKSGEEQESSESTQERSKGNLVSQEQGEKEQSGVITLPSGLKYEVIQAGKGKIPGQNDTVSLHYTGFRPSGEQIDSSYMGTAPKKLVVSSMIDGWKEALLRMKVGAIWKLHIPSHLAYGDVGSLPLYFGTPLTVDLVNTKENLKAFKKKYKNKRGITNFSIRKGETVIYEIKLVSIDL